MKRIVERLILSVLARKAELLRDLAQLPPNTMYHAWLSLAVAVQDVKLAVLYAVLGK